MSALLIRAMRRDEVDWAVDRAAAEGWNPGLRDADAFYAQDPGGFLLGLADGEPAGCISAVRYADGFGFIGFYIVRPELRGRGHGLRLWRAAMDRLQGRVVGLDGVFEQQANYARSGFVFQYSNVRFELPDAARRAEPAGDPAAGPIKLRPLAAADLPALAAYERELFPAAREPFLRAWLTMDGAVALGAFGRAGPAGWGLLRPCREGAKIGPLFADDPALADALFRALCARAAGGPVYLDVPEVNAPGMALARAHGMRRVFGTARMYAGPPPALRLERIFGVTSFELG
jgi:hypothetical protein